MPAQGTDASATDKVNSSHLVSARRLACRDPTPRHSLHDNGKINNRGGVCGVTRASSALLGGRWSCNSLTNLHMYMQGVLSPGSMLGAAKTRASPQRFCRIAFHHAPQESNLQRKACEIIERSSSLTRCAGIKAERIAGGSVEESSQRAAASLPLLSVSHSSFVLAQSFFWCKCVR